MISLHIVAGFITGVLLGAAIWSAAEYITTWKDTNR